MVLLGLAMAGAAGDVTPNISPRALAQDAAERPEDYPDLPGRTETLSFCTGCHGFKLVAAQGLDRAAWDRTLTWMSERQGMAAIEGEARSIVLDYLAGAFPPRSTGQPGGWRNPFAQ